MATTMCSSQFFHWPS